MSTGRWLDTDNWSLLIGSVRRYAIFTLDTQGVITSWNRGVGELLGYQEHEFVGQHGAIIFTEEDRANGVVEDELSLACAHGEVSDDRWHLRKDGSRLWVNGIMHALRNAAGSHFGYLKILRDQSDKRAADFRLHRQRALVTAILDSLPGIFYVSDGQRLVRWNDELELVTGMTHDELATADVAELVAETDLAREHFDEVLREGHRSFEGNLRTKAGTAIPYLFTSHRVGLGGEPLVLGVGIENWEQVRAREQLVQRAETDDLTGLLKRVAFERRLLGVLKRAERDGSQVAVLFVDLDNFKQINDSLGHQAGDEVLKEVAHRLLDRLRDRDAIARHGGDEFVAFVPDVGRGEQVAHVAERLLEALQAPFMVDGSEVNVGGTIGIATYPDDGLDVRSLLNAADAAMYEGKAAGKLRFQHFDRSGSGTT